MPKPQTVTFSVRMTTDLRAALEAEAVAAGRSLNAEIVKRLAESLLGLDLDAEKGYSREELRAIVDGIDRRINEVSKYRDMLDKIAGDLAPDIEGIRKALGAPDESTKDLEGKLAGRTRKPQK